MSKKVRSEEIIEKKLGIPPDYQYKALFDSNFFQSNWHANKLKAIEYNVKFNKAMNVLDLGAGSGNFELVFSDKVKQITAVDYHKEALDFVKQILSKKSIKNVNVICCDIRNLSSIKKKGFYDLIILIDVIEHIDIKEAKLMVKELKRLLSPSGKVGVVTPNYHSLWIYIEHFLDRFTKVPHFEGEQHLAKYYPENLTSLFEKNGFKTESIKTFNLLSFIFPNRSLANFLCKVELKSNISFGNLLFGVFTNEKK